MLLRFKTGDAPVLLARKESLTHYLLRRFTTVFVTCRIDDVVRCIEIELPQCLQTMDGKSGETYLNCMRLWRPDLPRFKDAFHRIERYVCTDGDGAVARGERGLANIEASDYIHGTCEAHVVQGFRKKVSLFSSKMQLSGRCTLVSASVMDRIMLISSKRWNA